uniref:Uncharacterized protein n=1 Tax=Oryza sativa subsp. japonica TaxID=39947 RepID=Q6EQ78_ORYSJ|nr:hypothetical protein [Oryza sativa Japonica Group]BAD29192.1 hypothetical protein [Oryza sativa Japonica Group]
MERGEEGRAVDGEGGGGVWAANEEGGGGGGATELCKRDNWRGEREMCERKSQEEERIRHTHLLIKNILLQLRQHL